MAFLIATFVVLCVFAFGYSLGNKTKIELSEQNIVVEQVKHEASAEDVTSDMFGNAIYPQSYDAQNCSPFELLQAEQLRHSHF